MSFLSAEWRKLAVINYEIDPVALKDYIPYGTELDLFENKCFVSLVGFMFINTKLMGIKIPFHTNFEEVNLRFYVKRKEGQNWKRGVVFIKEIVPKPALSLIANLCYHENYETRKMRHDWNIEGKTQVIRYQWKQDQKWNTIQVTANVQKKSMAEESLGEFILEHYWGYARVDKRKTFEYEVTHATWNVYRIEKSMIDVDFERVYGLQFASLTRQNPHSVMMAEGSVITVENKTIIRA